MDPKVKELVERRALQKTIQQILSQNRLVQKQQSKDIVEGLGAQENKGDSSWVRY